MGSLIAIETRRYSEFFKRMLRRYQQDAMVTIDGRKYQSDEVDQLLETWCVNQSIKATLNFHLVHYGREIAGFHDGPDNTWVDVAEEPFIRELANEQIVHYKVLPVK